MGDCHVPEVLQSSHHAGWICIICVDDKRVIFCLFKLGAIVLWRIACQSLINLLRFHSEETSDSDGSQGIREIIFSDQLCANLMAFTVLTGFPFESEIRRIVSNLSVDIEIIFSSLRNQVQSLRDIHQISVIVMNKGDGIFLTEEII